MERENKTNFSEKISLEKDDYMKNIRDNLYNYLKSSDTTLVKFAEESDVTVSALNNILYGNPKDCKLSTVIKIAKALGISLDELAGAETINENVMRNIINCRNLPTNAIYLIRWFINHQVTLYNRDARAGQKIISVMNPLHTNDGILKVTNNFGQIDISNLPIELRDKVFFGLNLGCDWYMPLYSPFDVLLLANDRAPFPKEHVVIVIGDNIFLAKQKREDGHTNYYGIRDGKFRCNETAITDVVGYVTGIMSNESMEDGRR